MGSVRRPEPPLGALVAVLVTALAAASCAENGPPPAPADAGDGMPSDGFREYRPLLVVTPAAVSFGDLLLGATSAAVQIGIRNDGNGGSAPLEMSTSDAAFRLTAATCGGPLGPGQSCTVDVVFVAEERGPRTGSLNVRAGEQRASVSLSGRGARAAVLTISPTAASFGDVPVGSETLPATFQVKNEGDLDMPPPALSVTGPFMIAAESCEMMPVLAGGAGCSVSVSFSPDTLGPQAGVLTVAAPGLPPATATLGGRGVSDAAALALSPARVDFGSVPRGSRSGPSIFRLTNDGSRPITDVKAAITGSPDFVLDDACRGTVPAGGGCDLTVSFQPQGEGALAATLVASWPGGAAMAALDGVGIPRDSDLVADRSAIDFGAVDVSGGGVTQMVTFLNGSETPLALELAIDGAGAGDYHFESGCPRPLAPGASCLVQVTFAPAAPGASTAVLAAIGEPAGLAQVYLQGTGVSHDPLRLSAAAGNFGSFPVGAAAPSALPFTVTNDGALPSPGPLQVAVACDGDGDFLITTDTCSGVVLAPGESCAVDVRFLPAGVGPRTASLSVAAGDLQRFATLGGAGLPATPLQIDPRMVDAGQVAVSQSSAGLPVTVTNTGQADSPVLALAAPAPFALGADGCTGRTLPAGQSCQAEVHFSPVAARAFVGVLTVEDADGAPLVAARLRGAGR